MNTLFINYFVPFINLISNFLSNAAQNDIKVPQER